MQQATITQLDCQASGRIVQVQPARAAYAYWRIYGTEDGCGGWRAGQYLVALDFGLRAQDSAAWGSAPMPAVMDDFGNLVRVQ